MALTYHCLLVQICFEGYEYDLSHWAFLTSDNPAGVDISAAAGKTATVTVQIFGSLSKLGPRGRSNMFGDGIIVFGAFMLVGTALTE
ncbi:hypothetical protein UA08_02470 [Talaromyces atroroseus]|uniref:Uncharacterized protein n=1 Tax=Talaromyces atroroseus TaxID=1441469 RepID=A0A225ATT2_TALAT|nr:hypothetical protein UA08_02470 [Talaromyces atroroseus]OKL61774.1 hypothetical protein UA08_02470 [Talaromyces atroroseus]